jgi:hypothetical protein
VQPCDLVVGQSADLGELADDDDFPMSLFDHRVDHGVCDWVKVRSKLASGCKRAMYLRAIQPIIVNHPPIRILPSAGTTKQHTELLAFGFNPSSCVASALSRAMLLRATPPTEVNTPA